MDACDRQELLASLVELKYNHPVADNESIIYELYGGEIDYLINLIQDHIAQLENDGETHAQPLRQVYP